MTSSMPPSRASRYRVTAAAFRVQRFRLVFQKNGYVKGV
jgi:hypothetical protein